MDYFSFNYKTGFLTVWHCYLELLRGRKEEFSYHFKNS